MRRKPRKRKRPVYWSLIIFAAIGAVFAIWAMHLVPETDRNEIALLYLGLVGGYAASIKELDLARMEIDRLRASAINQDNRGSEEKESHEKQN